MNDGQDRTGQNRTGQDRTAIPHPPHNAIDMALAVMVALTALDKEKYKTNKE